MRVLEPTRPTIATEETSPSQGWVLRGFAALLALHGVAHLAGVTIALDAVDSEDGVGYAFGTWDIDDPGRLWMLVALWGVTGVGFWLAAATVLLDRPLWPAITAAVGVVSLMLCLVALPLTVIGVAVNLVVLWLVFWWRSGQELPGSTDHR